MFARSGFSPQQQFHLLIDFDNDERSITVLPDHNRMFLILDQGLVLGKLGFDKHFNITSRVCRFTADVLGQLIRAIRVRYT